MRIVFATGNENKMREIRQILGDIGLEIISMKEAGISADIVEDGSSFEENALIKARAVSNMCGDIVIADDSGLEVDYLDKAPGIYSARFMGEDTSYDIKNQAIIDKLDGVPKEDRTARFVCAMAAVLPSDSASSTGKEEIVTRGTIEGIIGYEIAGENGFGYDPIFYVEEFGCTTAELSPAKKNEVSHRGRALVAMREKLLERNLRV